MDHKITQPAFMAPHFNCPYCQAFAGMSWSLLTTQGYANFNGLSSARCQSCSERSVWRGRVNSGGVYDMAGIADSQSVLVYPLAVMAQPAHSSMPESIRSDFEEARQIASASPRSAAALLRLCVEKLCRELTGKNVGINDQIADLVANHGLPPKIQKALDTVRVIGNEAVHPGTLDLGDSEKYVFPLFRLINLIVEEIIATPAEIDDLFESLPDGKREGIQKRDAPKQNAPEM